MDNLQERLLARRLVDEKTACWNWTGCVNSSGRGCIGYKGKVHQTHRVAAYLWMDAELEAEDQGRDTVCVLHHCDNPLCFNPEHLYLGTRKENRRDMERTGGLPRRTMRKLNDNQVRQVRALKSEGFSNPQIGQMVGASPMTVSRIVRGIMYKDVVG